MALTEPPHSPRAGIPQDISSQILSKVGSTSSKELTAELASSWVANLNKTISHTKAKIHERVHTALPLFNRQLTSTKSVEERLVTITHRTDELEAAVSSPQSGIVPTLTNALEVHSTLAQRVLNAEVRHATLEYLFQCRKDFDALDGSVNKGQLAEAVEACQALEHLLTDAPVALATSEAIVHLRRRLRAVKDRTEEQLGDAFSRGIAVSPREITIRPSIQVRQSQTILPLVSVTSALTKLSASSIAECLSTIRRDLTTHHITYLATQPSSLSVSPSNSFISNTEVHTLSIVPAPPNTEDRATRLQNLSQLFDFLAQHLFPLISQSSIQTSEIAAFVPSLAKPLSQALLHHFLIPLLPSALQDLPHFLTLVTTAVGMEGKYLVRMLGTDERDREIKSWAQGVTGHWERKRRAEVLQVARTIILRGEDGDRVTAELEIEIDSVPSKSMLDETVQQEVVPKVEDGDGEEDAWGLEDQSDEKAEVENGIGTEGDGWGFDDEIEERNEAAIPPSSSTKANADEADEAWGWNDEEDAPNINSYVASNGQKTNGIGHSDGKASSELPPNEPQTDPDAWDDDPWGDSSSSPPSATQPLDPQPPPKSPPTAIKRATRLEKLANKTKGKHLLHASHSPSTSTSLELPPHTPSSIGSPAHIDAPPPTPLITRKTEINRPQKITVPVKAPTRQSLEAAPVQVVVPQKVKETYAITARARSLATTVQSILSEGLLFSVTEIFNTEAIAALLQPENVQKRGAVLGQSAPSMLDLWRALYPVKFKKELDEGMDKGMIFANDCTYLGLCAKKLALEAGDATGSEKEKFMEASHRLTVLGDSWYEDLVEKQMQIVTDCLVQADGFVETGDQERFDECESAVSKTMGLIRNVARSWKIVLSKTKYMRAIGCLVDAALSHMLADISALPDITEVESHRLSELCRIFNALEGLFMAGPEESSIVVAHVPSWLKFSYLSELLEASLADVSYLFEEGALVDFEIDELVRLVKALFAETPQRSSLISKFTAGNAQPAS